jgi:hypothetical protein
MYARAKEVAEGMLGKANVKIAPQTMGGEEPRTLLSTHREQRVPSS